MGMDVYLAFDHKQKAPNANPADRVFLLGFQDELRALATRLGVTPLDEFYSVDVEQLRGLVDDEMLAEIASTSEPVRYLEPAAALPTVRALRQHLSNTPEPFTFSHNAERCDSLISELQESETTLLAAEAARIKFRFFPGE